VSARKAAAKLGRPARAPGEKHTRERIFDAAVELFAEQGYERTTVRQIAEAVGLTEGAVYRHYRGKEAILDAIVALMDEAVSVPVPFALEPGAVDGRAVVKYLIEGVVDVFAADPSMPKIARILYAEASHNARVRAYLKASCEARADEAIGSLFESCMEKGLFRRSDPRRLARVFNGFRFWWTYQMSILDRDEAFDEAKLKESLREPREFFESLLVPGEE
jgi:AcrR family transcriptional regulator